MAGTEVGSLYYTLEIDDKGVPKVLSENEKRVEDFGKSMSTMGERLASGMKKVGAGMAVAGAGLTLIAKNATDFTVDLVKSSTALGRQIGVSVTEASRLTAAFSRMGLQTENVQQMFGIFSKNIVESTKNIEKNRLAADALRIDIDKTKNSISQTTEEIRKNGDKSGELGLKLRELNSNLAQQESRLKSSTDAFTRLGVSTVDAQGKQRGFTEILFDVADKFQAMPDGIDKTAASMELFGRSGKDMLKVLNLGSEGIRELEREADKLGLTLNSDTIGKVNDLVQSQKELKRSQDALKIAIGTTTAPVLAQFNEKLNEMLTALLQAPEPIRGIVTGFLAFGGVALTTGGAVIALVANLVTAAPAFKAFADAIKLTAAAQWLLNIAMAANPIVWIVALIVGLIAVFVLLYQHNETFRNGFNAVWESVWGKLQEVFGWLQANWPTLLAILFGPFGLAAKLIYDNWEGITGWFRALPGKIGGFFSGLASTISAPFRDAFNGIKNYWNSTVGRINFKAPDWVPGFGGRGWAMPKFAAGGVVTGPTVGLMGEAGNEAVLPLSYLNRYNTLFDRIEQTVRGIRNGDGTGGGDIYINIENINDRADADYLLHQIDRNGDLESKGGSPRYGGTN